MLLRLCVAVLVGTLTQALWANEVSDFEAGLASAQENFHEGCLIKSAAMKVAYACSKIQSPTANPRFHDKIDAGSKGAPSTSSSGINWCYNSIIEVKRDGGKILVNVTRDVGVTARGLSFSTQLTDQQKRSGEVVLPIEATKGLCFGNTKPIKEKCRSFFGNEDRPLILVADVDNKDLPDYNLTADSKRINSSAAKISQQTNLNEAAEGNRRAILYARAQLVAYAKNKMSPNAPTEYPYPASPGPKTLPYPQSADSSPTLDAAFSQCDRMLINLENSMNPMPDADPRDLALLAEYRQRIKTSSKEKVEPATKR